MGPQPPSLATETWTATFCATAPTRSNLPSPPVARPGDYDPSLAGRTMEPSMSGDHATPDPVETAPPPRRSPLRVPSSLDTSAQYAWRALVLLLAVMLVLWLLVRIYLVTLPVII